MYDGVNKGFRHARGHIFAYLNSDDLYFPWTLEVVVAAFERVPDADVVFGDALGVRDETGAEDIRFQPDLGYAFYLRSGSLVQPAVFWRRRVYEELGGFDTSLRYAGDLEYWLRLGRERKLLRVDEFLAVERDHGEAKRFSDAPILAAEARRAREAHDNVPLWTRRAGLVWGRFRAWWARRVLWLRLVKASQAHEQGTARPWGHFLTASRLSLPPVRILLGQVPWLGPRLASGSITTGVDWLDREE
jgi:GT2 family glycosyltransferase